MFHPDLVGIQVRVLQRLGSKHVLVVYGKDGMDEVSLGAATMVGELKDGEVREYEIHPEDFGLSMISNRGLKVADATESKEMVLEALGDVEGTPREIVVLNAGVALYAADVATSIARRHRAGARGDRLRRGEAEARAIRRADAEARRRERLTGAAGRWPTSSPRILATKADEIAAAKARAAAARVAAGGAGAIPAARFRRGAPREDRGRPPGGHRRDQEGESEPRRAARRLRSARDRRELRERRARRACPC